jgi:hypothetical protein
MLRTSNMYFVYNTDKKENLIFLKYKEIQDGAVAKSYMSPHIWGNICAFPHILGSPSSFMTLTTLNFLIYEENVIFFFISEYRTMIYSVWMYCLYSLC